MMIINYFTAADKIIWAIKDKFKYLITFLYFPILIFVIAVNMNYDELTSFSIRTGLILIFLFAMPLLMIPSYYFLRGLDFFVFKNFIQSIATSDLNFKENYYSIYSKRIFYYPDSNKSNNYGVFVLDRLQKVLKIEFGSKLQRKIAKKKITPKKIRLLKDFYHTEGHKYFDLAEVTENVFLSTFTNCEYTKVLIYSDLSLIESGDFLADLKDITGWYYTKLAGYFHFKDKNNKFVYLNVKSINVARSQRLKEDKVKK